MTMVSGRTGAGNAVQGRNWVWIQQAVPVNGGRVYEFSVWARNNGGQYPCTIGFRGGPSSGETFRQQFLIYGNWEQKTMTVTVPQDATWGAIFLQDGGLGSSNNGVCIFDDVTLREEIPPQPNATNVVVNGEFDTNANYWANQGPGTSSMTIVAGRAGSGNAVRTQGGAWLQQTVSLAFFREYRLSAWGRTTDPTKPCVVGLRGGPTGSENFRQQAQFTETSWTQQVMIVSIPSNATWVAAYLADSQAACEFDSITITDAANVTNAGEVNVPTVQPAINLISDPGFALVAGTNAPAINYAWQAARPSVWTFRPATILTLVAAPNGNTPDRNGNSGSGAMKTTIGSLYQSLNLPGASSGRTLRFTAWVKRQGLANCALEVYGMGDTSQPGWGGVIQSVPFTNTAWEQKTIDFIVPSGSAPVVTTALKEDARTPNTIYESDNCQIDDVSLSDGFTNTYAEDTTTNILNPDRGFREAVWLNYDFSNIRGVNVNTVSYIQNMRSNGYTMLQAYVPLMDFKSSSTLVGTSLITTLRQRLDVVRASGVKVSLRFFYSTTYLTPGTTYTQAQLDAAADPPLSRMITHLADLQGVFTDYSDVISVVQAGMFGPYGEWAQSVNNSGWTPSTTSPATSAIYNIPFASKQQLFNALRNNIPANIRIQLRQPQDIFALVKGSPYATGDNPTAPTLTQTQWLTDPNWSRMGHHNDCFMQNSFDGATYGSGWSDPLIPTWRNYLVGLARYIPISGEMCEPNLYLASDNLGTNFPGQANSPNRYSSTWTHAQNIAGNQDELRRFRWSWIAEDFGPGPTDWWLTWRHPDNTPFINTVRNRLGYRFHIASSTVPNLRISSGGSLTLGLVIANRGYAAPFNPRNIRVVLRNASNTYRITVNTSNPSAAGYVTGGDSRFWDSETTNNVNLSVPLSGVAAGTYDILVQLADAAPTGRTATGATATAPQDRWEYSIRLASTVSSTGKVVWEPSTGYNDIDQKVTIF